jgi:glycosyltransferase involved in cell wall biosynthesis
VTPAEPAARDTRKPRVTIVLPARNEEATIGATIRCLPIETLAALGFETEVFVLDGRSHDRTAAIANQMGAVVVPDRQRGKGAALRNARALFNGDYVVMLDADGTYAADAIPRAVALLVRGQADVVMGHRLLQHGSMKGTHLVGNVVLSMLASVLYNTSCPDLCTGLWAFRRHALQALPIQSNGFDLEAELFSLSSRMGLRIERIRVDYLPRDGAAKLDFGADGLAIVQRLVRTRFLSLDELAEPLADTPPARASSKDVKEAHA